MAHAQPLLPRPSRPFVWNKTPDVVEIAWHSGQFANENRIIEYYNLKKVRKVNDNDWIAEEEKIKANENESSGQVSTVIQLEPNCSYRYAVTALYSDGSASALSGWSDVISINEEGENLPVSLKDKALALAKVVKKGNPTVHQLNLTSSYESKSENIRKFEVGQKNVGVGVIEKVIMLVGATGAGKSTFINAMANYLFDIKWEDDVRLRLIDEDLKADQADSQTKHITSYTIHGTKLDFLVTIIDTPGFGDSGGYTRDEEISKEMHTFFTSSAGCITHVDAVGFVTQASLPRLTPTQKYIFDKILSLFGKDIKDNIMMLFTFADGNEPQVLSGIKRSGFHFSDHFTFNNTDLFEEKRGSKRQNMMNELAWEISIDGYDGFFKAIEKYPQKSLVLTKEVLEERNILQASVISIHRDIKNGLGKLENLRMEIKIVQQLDQDINDNRKYEYTVEEDVQEERITEFYSYNCRNCLKTCVTGRYSFYSVALQQAVRMLARIFFRVRNEKRIECVTCKCKESDHEYSKIEWETVRKLVTKTIEDMKNRYEQSKETKLTKEKLIAELKADFDKHQANTLLQTERVRKIVERLNEIALKPNPISSLEYIDLMILQEKADAEPGFLERVTELQDLREKTDVLMKIIESDDKTDVFPQDTSNAELWTQVMDVIKGDKVERKAEKEYEEDEEFDK